MNFKITIHRPFTLLALMNRIVMFIMFAATTVCTITVVVTIIQGKMMDKTGMHIGIITYSSYVNAAALAIYLPTTLMLGALKHVFRPFEKEYYIFFTFLDEFYKEFYRNRDALRKLALPKSRETIEMSRLLAKRTVNSVTVAEGMRIVKDTHVREAGQSNIVFDGFCYPELEGRFRRFLDYLVFVTRPKPWADTYNVTLVDKGSRDFWN